MLRPIYYWPGMDSDIENICKQCSTCRIAQVRRQKLQADFDTLAPQSHSIPRQHYGFDFCGVQGGEILVIVVSKSRHFQLTRVRTRQDTIGGRLLC
jgi:hypothetical protein